MTQNTSRRKKKKKWPWVLLILAAAAVFAFFQLRGTMRPGYKQAEAVKRDIATYYTFSGNLTPITDELQMAQEQLKVKEVYVSQGDTVKEGDSLFRAADGTRVSARAAGTVETLSIQADDLLKPGDQIARIVGYDKLEVSVDVDEYDIGALSVGKKGEVYINALGLTVPGTVAEIARDATTLGGVSFYAVKLQIVADGSILSGMSAEVKVIKEAAKQALCLNISVISYDEDNNPFVLVREGDKEMVRRYLVTGISDGVFVQILSGLKENEPVYYVDTNMVRFFAPRRSVTTPQE